MLHPWHSQDCAIFSNETLRQLLFMVKAETSRCTMVSALAKLMWYSLLCASTNLRWPEAIISIGHNGSQKHYSHNTEECKCIISWPPRMWYVALLFKKFWNWFAMYLCLLAHRKFLLTLVLLWPPRRMNGSHMWSLKTSTRRTGGLGVNRLRRQSGVSELLWVGNETKALSQCEGGGGGSKQGRKTVREIFLIPKETIMAKQRWFNKCISGPWPAVQQWRSVKSYPCANWAPPAPSRKVHLLELRLNLAQQNKEERCAAGRARPEALTGNQGLLGWKTPWKD